MISLKDGKSTQEWECLKTWMDHCAKGHCGIVFHLQNHYAPVYGYREIKGRRQILVPSAGQSPSAWSDFRSVRDTIAQAGGHTMLVAFTSSPKDWGKMSCS